MALSRRLAGVALVALLASVATQARSERTDWAAERRAAAEEAYAAAHARWLAGAASIEDVHQWSVRWYEADRQANPTAAATAHAERMRKLAGAAEERVRSGMAAADETLAARYFRAEAELWLDSAP